jgi:predicted metal-binding membrane protein
MTVVRSRRAMWRRLWWTHPELSLGAVAAAAWLAVLAVHAGVAGHDHGTSVGLWVLMATAMMLPTALPTARSIALNGKWRRRQRGPALFAAGYLAVWSALGALLLWATWSIGPQAHGPLAIAGALAVAAVWETTRWKRLCLRSCHRVRSLPPDGWKADRAAVHEGIRNGVWCTASCGPVMAAMALAPHPGAVLLMLFLSAVVAAEKLVTGAGDHLGQAAAALAAAAVVVVAVAPVS